MDEIIRRQDALEAINRIWDKCEEIEAHLPDGDPDKTGYKMIGDYLTVWKYLSAQPEIVRCKDCKHHHYARKDIPYCDRNDYGYGWKDDDYCSQGERRADGRD